MGLIAPGVWRTGIAKRARRKRYEGMKVNKDIAKTVPVEKASVQNLAKNQTLFNVALFNVAARTYHEGKAKHMDRITQLI